MIQPHSFAVAAVSIAGMLLFLNPLPHARAISSSWVNHTWTFLGGSTQNSYILNRTDSTYLNYIASVDAQCRNATWNYTWKPHAGDDTYWEEFGIPECGSTTTQTSSTTTYTTSTSSTTSTTSSTSSGSPTSGSGSTTTTSGTAPTPPSNLSVTIGTTNTDVKITWTDNASNESKFQLFRRYAGGTWAMVAEKPADITQHIDSSVSVGSYEYYIRACNNYGCSSGAFSSSLYIGTSDGMTTTTSNWVRHTWVFQNNVTTSSYILNRTDSTYTNFIAEMDARCKLAYYTTWMPHAGDDTYWQEFGIPVCSTITNTATTTATATSTATTTMISTYSTATTTAVTTATTTVPVQSYTATTTTTYYLTPTFPRIVGTKTIKGTVLTAGGLPVGDAVIGAYRSDTGDWTRAYSDATGAYQIVVNGGLWRVGVHPRDASLARWNWGSREPQTVSFSAGTAIEEQTVNFTVRSSDAKLQVLVKNAAGEIVPNVSVTIDTAGGSVIAGSTVTERQVLTMQTGSTGIAEFYLLPNTYYVRIDLPERSPYVYPSRRKISVGAGSSETVPIVLETKSAANTVTLTGVAKFSDNTPTSAHVGAWSDEGAFADTEASASGEFSLVLQTNSRWHIGAGKDAQGSYYKADAQLVDTSIVPRPIEIFLLPLTAPSSTTTLAPVTVTKSASLEVEAVSDTGASITLPPNAAGTTGAVTVALKPTVEAPPQSTSQVVGAVYDVTVSKPSGQAVTQLASTADIVLPYSESELLAKGSSEDAIVPSYFDEARNAWVTAESFTIDKVKNVVIIHTNHLTKFALLVAADTTPPFPPSSVVGNVQGGGSIKLSWINPTTDFKSAKVYRSEKFGSLGMVKAATVLTNTYTDDLDVVDGITYYYTVRSVDPAGNESSNTDVTIVKAVGTSPKLAPVSNSPTLLLPPGQALKVEIARDLRVGTEGDDVKILQQLLKDEGVYPNGLITGYFGALTKQAVIRFQEKYAADILIPAGLTSGTGLVGKSSRKKINDLLGASKLAIGALPPGQAVKQELLRDLREGSSGDDVKILQQLLKDEGVYPNGLITGYFGALTKQAVIRFQEKYAADILIPAGLVQGTGIVGAGTRGKIKNILGR